MVIIHSFFKTSMKFKLFYGGGRYKNTYVQYYIIAYSILLECLLNLGSYVVCYSDLYLSISNTFAKYIYIYKCIPNHTPSADCTETQIHVSAKIKAERGLRPLTGFNEHAQSSRYLNYEYIRARPRPFLRKNDVPH